VSQGKRKETRAEQTEHITRRIREVALEHIAKLGVDGLSMIGVAEDAGISKSPLYRRYDDAIDLTVDVWDHQLRTHLQTVLDHTLRFADTGDAEALTWLISQIHRPSTESVALIECIAVARRYEYLQETIEIDVTRELESYVQSLPQLPVDISLSYVVYVLGGLFIGSLLPCTEAETRDALLLWDQYLRDPSLRVDREMPNTVRPIPLTYPEADDPTLGNLVVAATKVIMRTGFENATANRIARYANRAFSSSYAYFDSKEELMLYATEFIFRDSIVRNDIMFLAGDEEEHIHAAASRIRELTTQSASEDARLFRIEATLAARHHDELGRSIRNLFKQSLEQILMSTNKNQKAQDEVRSVWIGVRTAGFGHNVFGLVATGFVDVDWMSTARAAALVVSNHAMKNYRADVLKEMAS
jgi:AcrR family transcriptional regulator